MSTPNRDPGRSDALVLFGATGDLAHKKIFPALYAMAKRGALTVPVIGVARSKWDLERFQARVRDSIAQDVGGIDDEQALDRLIVAARIRRMAITATPTRSRRSGKRSATRRAPRTTSRSRRRCSRP